MADTPYAHIAFGDAFQRDLVREAAERVDTDGVKRAYHSGTQTFWEVPGEAPARRVGPPLDDTLLLRRVFTVEVVWRQAAEQSHTDDWGSLIGNALIQEGDCSYDLASGPVELLHGEAVPDR